MSKQPFRTLRSQTVVLPMDHVDTDQIIPARFLKGHQQRGARPASFRRLAVRRPREPPPGFRAEPSRDGEGKDSSCRRELRLWFVPGARPLGTSRLRISRRCRNLHCRHFYKANALKNGLLPVVVDGETQRHLIDNPGLEVTIDLEQKFLILPDGRQVGFPIDGFARYCLIHAMDELDFLIEQDEHISAYESRLNS